MKVTRKQLRKLIKEMMDLKKREDDVFIGGGPLGIYPSLRNQDHTLYTKAGYFKPGKDPYEELDPSVKDVFSRETQELPPSLETSTLQLSDPGLAPVLLVYHL